MLCFPGLAAASVQAAPGTQQQAVEDRQPVGVACGRELLEQLGLAGFEQDVEHVGEERCDRHAPEAGDLGRYPPKQLRRFVEPADR